MKTPRYFRFILFLALYCFSAVDSTAESKREIEVRLAGGIYLTNDQAWILEPTVDWNFHKYLGIGIGVELTQQYNQPSRQTIIGGYEASLTDLDRNAGWIIFKPHALIKSPSIWRSRDDNLRLWFEAAPGISLACPFNNSLTYEIKEFHGNVSHTVDYKKIPNNGLKWFYWNVRIGANFAFDRFTIGAGYYISSLDYYSCRRDVRLPNGEKFYVPKKELSQSIYLSAGYSF